MSRTPEREATYQWIGPLVYNDWTLFAMAGASKPALLEETRQMRIGSYRGDAIVTYLQERGFNVDIASSDELNPSKLAHRRIDYWATGRLIGEYRLRRQGITDIVPVLTFNRTDMYLACQKDIPAPLVLRLNQALDSLNNRGVVARIYADYGYTP